MKKLLATSSIALALGLAAAPANAFIVDGIEVDAGATLAVADVYEDTVLAVGDTLSGIGQVGFIKNKFGAFTWLSGDNGRELTFAFDGFILETVVPTTQGADLYFSGGHAEFYSDATPDFSINQGQAANLANATDGDLWLGVTAAASYGTCGILPIAGTCLNGDATGITLISSVNSANLAAVSGGDGAAFFDAVSGSALNNFDTDGVGGLYDFDASFDFDDFPPTGDYDLSGSADFKAAPIAEPVSLGLMGASLAGLGLLGRRKKA